MPNSCWGFLFLKWVEKRKLSFETTKGKMCKKIIEQDIRNYLQKFGYELIEYVNGNNGKVKQLIKHLECGYSYPVRFNDFKSGRRCPSCSGKARITGEHMKDYFLKFGYELLRHEEGIKKHQIIKHLECGYEYPVTFDNFKNKGTRCPNCYGNRKTTKQDISDYLQQFGYELIVYVDGNIAIVKQIVKHVECGYIFPVRFDHFKNSKSRCPNCSKFRTENLCREIFESLFQNYKFPNTRPDFLHGLELDGYCPELCLAFEYNGIQHYEVVDFFPDSQEQLEKRQEHDRRKLELCSQQGINVCVIPYTYDCYEPKKLEAFIRTWARAFSS
jgi:hypothetical protein